jgi:TPR repeat protein
LERGIGIKKDEAKAAEIYKELARCEDNGLAQYHYGRMCHNGIGVPVDYEQAKKYYLMAIENNITEAKQNYGVLLATQMGQWRESARYLEMAMCGDGAIGSAKFNYAQMLLRGLGVAMNKEEAEILLRDAAETFIPAMVALAEILEAKHDPGASAAAEWFRNAADAEDVDERYVNSVGEAQYKYACMLKAGVGVAKDEELWKVYLDKAAKNGCPEAVREIAENDGC